MTNYNKNPFFVLLITIACFNTYSQTSNSPTISLNKVLLNPAFAGDKGKNRISIQNSYNDYQHDYKQDYANNFVDPNDFRNNANASNNTSYWANYANLNNSISYDGYSNKTGIGYLFNIGSTVAHESNEKWNNSSNSNFVQKESKFTTGHIGESYSIKTLGAGLNYKFFLKAKEDENPGTLSLGLYYSLSQYSIQRSDICRRVETLCRR